MQTFEVSIHSSTAATLFKEIVGIEEWDRSEKSCMGMRGGYVVIVESRSCHETLALTLEM